MTQKALLLVDIQNDFMPTGPLPVADSDSIIPVVNKLSKNYELIVACQDWHPENHKSFANEHPGKKPFDTIELNNLEQTLWPVHCVQGSRGADFPELLDTRRVAAIFRKGMRLELDSYSAFYDNGHRLRTGIAAFLRDHQVSHLDIAGLAADVCVYYTILDALDQGFVVTLITAATRAIDATGWAHKKSELLSHPDFQLE